jgi:hypothetical protein
MTNSCLLDKNKLEQIVSNDFKVPDGLSTVDCLPDLMHNLGSIDSETREGSLDVLWTWISNSTYTDDVLLSIANHMATNLTIGLGEKECDSVFLRAFSTLILAAVIEVDLTRMDERKPHFLDQNQVLSWLSTTITLLKEEKDLRGFIEAKGWAHCCAHTGDLLGDLAVHPYLGKKELEDILNSLQARFTTPVEETFIHNEDERLAAVVMNILQRELVTEEFFKTWLDGFVSNPERMDWKKAFTRPTWNCARVNTKAFLRGIYFFLIYGYKDRPEHRKVDMADKLKSMLLNTLKQIYPNSRYADEN